MQTALCFITLIFVNGVYLFVSFNMESMLPDTNSEQKEEVIFASLSTNMDFDPADILDLDILDFAVDELSEGSDRDDSTDRRPHLVHDRV
jgi:hypothetical protein